MHKPASRNEWFIGVGFVALAMATHFLLGVHALVRVVGVACVLTGLYWLLTRRIPLGLEGQPASFHLTGMLAVVVGIAMVVLGVLLVWFAPAAACVLGWSGSPAC